MRTSRLFGLDFAVDTSIEEVVDLLERDGRSRTSQWRVVVTPNVDHSEAHSRTLPSATDSHDRGLGARRA